MATVMTRAERQARTRQALLEAAREAFLEHGYDGASLAAIAADAGATTGAIYANFNGKDDLFFAVLDARAEDSRRRQEAASLTQEKLEDGIRAAARMLLNEEEDARWARLVAAYWARASHDEAFRAAAAQRARVILDRITVLVEELARRHGMETVLPARELARGGGALVRGIRLERAMGLADDCTAEIFEAMFLAYVRGLMRPADRERNDREGTR
jgi:AcrR family transcriptional regulator